jgi:predicted dehydrogenase
MVNVGVVGLGPGWETRFGPALRKLRERIAVCAIYDPVASRAAQVARQWNATAVDGVVAMSERADLRGFLLLDPGWHGWESLRYLCEPRKPVFIAAGFGRDFSTLRTLHEQVRTSGQTLMPGLSARYTPATCRLRELMATSLGRPQRINIDAYLPMPESTLSPQRRGSVSEGFLHLLDWCRYVVGAAPTQVHAHHLNGYVDSGCGDRSVTLKFENPRTTAAPVNAVLRIHRQLDEESADLRSAESACFDQAADSRAEVVCERGTAAITSATEITWNVGNGPVREILTWERSTVEVMLDLFCRRIVGGLIPLPDLADVVQGLRLHEAAERSLTTGQPVDLNGG